MASSDPRTGARIDPAARRGFAAFLAAYLRPFRKLALIVTFTSVPLFGLAFVIPVSFKNATDFFRQADALYSVAFWMAVGLGALVLKAIFDVINAYGLTVLHASLARDIRADLYARLQAASFDVHIRSRSGEVANLLSNDVQHAAMGALQIYFTAFYYPLLIAVLSAVMLYFSPQLFLLSLLSFPIISLAVSFTARRAHHAERQFLDRHARVMGMLIESLVNVKQIKALGIEDRGRANLRAVDEELLGYRKRAQFMESLAGPITEVTNGVMLTLMVLVAYYLVANNQADYGEIIGCLVAAVQLRAPVRAFAVQWMDMQKSRAAVRRIEWIVGVPAEGGQSDAAESEPMQVNSVQFENVSFSYDGKHEILRGLDFTLRRGERVAVRGPSGSGKTTFVDLLVGFYPPAAGRILVNNQNLSALRPDHWRRNIGIVTQEPLLFEGSIEENVRIADPDAESERIERAMHLAGMSAMLAALPEGGATQVGERGKRLSGGERKRVALARALVRPISLLVLDEATSELDADIEESILESIDQLAADLLIVHVSHRDAILRHCDRVLDFKPGAPVCEVPLSEIQPRPRREVLT